MRRLLLIWVVFLAATPYLLHAGGRLVHAQTGCEDPFAGVESLRFTPDFWPLTDFCQHSVPYDEIIAGGPPPNGIPPIYTPIFETTTQARAWLHLNSPVIALQVGDEARAYPLAILTYHEIVNDEIAGVPVLVTFCPLCNSAIVFDRRVEGDVLTFGTTGNLRLSDLIMWDHRTQSWWQQFTGEAIVGAYTGARLTLLPSQVVGFWEFARQFPAGLVLSRETGVLRPYSNNPYAFYDTEGQPILTDAQQAALDTRLPPLSRVLAGVVGGQPVAYPFGALVRQMAINDTVGGVAVVAFWQSGVSSALDTPRIDQGRDVGTAALYRRDLDSQTLTFAVDERGVIRDEQTGSVWNAFGMAVEGALAGAQLEQLVAAGHFWFAWSNFYPDTIIYGREG